MPPSGLKIVAKATFHSSYVHGQRVRERHRKHSREKGFPDMWNTLGGKVGVSDFLCFILFLMIIYMGRGEDTKEDAPEKECPIILRKSWSIGFLVLQVPPRVHATKKKP